MAGGDVTFNDDTPIGMLAPDTGNTQTARLWTYARDERPWRGDANPAAWYKLSGDRRGLHRALDLKPWQPSPFEAATPAPPAWSQPGPCRDAWALAAGLRAELVAVAT